MRCLKSAACLFAVAALAAGCSTADTIRLSSQPDPDNPLSAPAAGDATAPASSGTGDQSGNRSAAISRNVRLQVAPVIGAHADAVPALSRRLTMRAGRLGLPVTPNADSATHILKGYFSTITDGGRTTVIYVWDVLDPAGNRLHRIQGQENATGGTGEGWAAVTGSTMEAIADRTMNELAAWLAANTA